MQWTHRQSLDARTRARRADPEGYGSLSDAAAQAIMDYAVELVAARGGTMTAEDLAGLAEWLKRRHPPGAEHPLLEHIAAQGTRIAVLEGALTLAPAGAEAKIELMRAACLESIRAEFEKDGQLGSHLWHRVLAAIEGAAP